MCNQKQSSLLKLAEQVAREAGALLLGRRGAGSRDVVSSAGRDIKLKSDKAAEALILDRLKAVSAIPILTEESGMHGIVEGVEDLWIVDPLDGSMNFNREIPLACVSIALWCKGEPQIGVVYDFLRDELFSAEVGRGAWLNGKSIRVSGVNEQSAGVFLTGIPSKARTDDKAMNYLTDRIRTFKKVRMLGAAALMLSWVACGRADAYAEDDIMFWDVAAGLALVKAAGGWTVCRSGTGQWQYHVKAASSDALFQGEL